MLLFVVVDIVVCYCCCCCYLLLLMFSCCSYPWFFVQFRKCFFFFERRKPENLVEKPSEQEGEQTPNSDNPYTNSTPGFEPGQHFWGAASALSTAPVPRPKSGSCPSDNNKLSELILHQSRMKQSLFSICLAGLLK